MEPEKFSLTSDELRALTGAIAEHPVAEAMPRVDLRRMVTAQEPSDGVLVANWWTPGPGRDEQRGREAVIYRSQLLVLRGPGVDGE